jgi:hypothetical protein
MLLQVSENKALRKRFGSRRDKASNLGYYTRRNFVIDLG